MLDPARTLMFAEAAEAPAAVRRLLDDRAAHAALAAGLRTRPPRAVVTLARGSSDNAATVARYLVETRVRMLTTSLSPSVASVYGAAPRLADTLLLAVSQSGRSPDLLAAAEAAREDGARPVTLVNDETSPLAAAGRPCLPLHAGPERSVAATKSFIAAVASFLLLVAEWSADDELLAATDTLPDLLDRAWALDWSPALEPLVAARHLYVVARGPALGIAQEMALKMKETCGLHAEAFSAAEVRHGPMALVEQGFPVLLLGQDDAGQNSVAELAALFAERGATVLHAGIGAAAGVRLPVLDAPPALQPLLAVQSFYRLANAVAVARGRDPDRPPHLRKVTETR
ncbi:SIS domain-containing protein [Sphingomonas aracearum]|uniref:SIS domain-containing protein n=1 Tax=Sphingomonas aracearum TaxID=2283317 RepID=A0A369VW64_9SPHN|nr:SIS domain-containing protein [Sphingomonas aracearum]RDE05817.1 SIS domain-containing protein [Sphingomonas aracearum]